MPYASPAHFLSLLSETISSYAPAYFSSAPPITWVINGPTWPNPVALGVAAGSASTAVSTVTSGKRRRGEAHDDGALVELHGL
jgi:hypothetical protein